MPANDNIRPAQSRLSPELEMRIKAFHEGIAKALCENLNRNVSAKSQSELQLIADAGTSSKDVEMGTFKHRSSKDTI
jgi:hypothetical protein